ncbi:MAG: hypothetical protein IH582_10330, partial [Afipia sp.]|nr:hypothetical protein [Afipia sp.]
FYLALPIVGYMPAITGLVVLAMLVCGDRSLLRIAVTSPVAVAFLHLVFSKLFLVTFP